MEKLSVSRPCVVVSTRESAPGERSFAQGLGLQLIDAPVIRYEWIDPDGSMIARVLSQGTTRAWVFTSRRGVQGWARVLASGGYGTGVLCPEQSNDATIYAQRADEVGVQTDPGSWCGKGLFGEGVLPAVYVVGERTRQVFLEVFQARSYRPTSLCMPMEHTGEALAQLLVSHEVEAAVHFCSRQRRAELAQVLGQAGVDLVSLEVYSGEPVGSVRQPLDMGNVDAVLFYSPRGVEAFARAYGTAENDWIAVACGATTAGAVNRCFGKLPLEAPGPDAKSMMKRVAEHVRGRD